MKKVEMEKEDSVWFRVLSRKEEEEFGSVHGEEHKEWKSMHEEEGREAGVCQRKSVQATECERGRVCKMKN